MGLVLVVRLAERVPNDVGHVLDQLPDLLETFRIRSVRTFPGFGEKLDFTEASDDAVELLEQGLDGRPVQGRLDRQVGRSEVLARHIRNLF